MHDEIDSRKTRRIASISSKLCGSAWVLFVVYIWMNQDLNEKFIIVALIGMVLCFLLPWQMTKLAARVLSNSSGAFRLAVALSFSWIFIESVAFMRPFRDNSKTDALFIFMIPLFIFWVTIWIIKGYSHDQKTQGGSVLSSDGDIGLESNSSKIRSPKN